nr:MAG TPA_asm: hypothetical protein [Caudoviricetes sp.]
MRKNKPLTQSARGNIKRKYNENKQLYHKFVNL